MSRLVSPQSVILCKTFPKRSLFYRLPCLISRVNKVRFCVKHFQRDHFLLGFHMSRLVSPQIVILCEQFQRYHFLLDFHMSRLVSPQSVILCKTFPKRSLFYRLPCLISRVNKVRFCVKHFQRDHFLLGFHMSRLVSPQSVILCEQFQRDHFLLNFHMSRLVSYQSVVLCKTFSK